MRVDIAFAGEIPRRNRVRAPLWRARTTKGFAMCVTSPFLTIISYHWTPEGPILHTTPQCRCQKEPLPTRYRGYLAGVLAGGPPDAKGALPQGVAELTEGAGQELDVLLGERKSLRGLWVHLFREDARNVAPVRVRLSEGPPVSPLPDPIDVRGFLHTLWGIPDDAPGAGPASPDHREEDEWLIPY